MRKIRTGLTGSRRFEAKRDIIIEGSGPGIQITSPSNSNKRRRDAVIIHPRALSLLTLKSVYLIKYH